jgi:Zn-dependent peptidase ImmA (M78 family)
MKAAQLRHGFKSEANRLARLARKDLGLDPEAPLDPRKLAHLRGVQVIPLSAFTEIPGAVDHLMNIEPGAFSAVTVFHGDRRVIVHNDGHLPGRQANDISHEMAHAFLKHVPAPALNIVGCRSWDVILESEASWLGAALLISDEAALHIVKEQMTRKQAAEMYGVSEELVNMRINVTGARRRVSSPALAKSPIARSTANQRGKGTGQ